MTLEEYYKNLREREKEFSQELWAGYEAILWDIEELLGKPHWPEGK